MHNTQEPFSRQKQGKSFGPQPHRAGGVASKSRCVDFVSGGWVGETKTTQRVGAKPAHPPLSPTTGKHIMDVFRSDAFTTNCLRLRFQKRLSEVHTCKPKKPKQNQNRNKNDASLKMLGEKTITRKHLHTNISG